MPPRGAARAAPAALQEHKSPREGSAGNSSREFRPIHIQESSRRLDPAAPAKRKFTKAARRHANFRFFFVCQRWTFQRMRKSNAGRGRASGESPRISERGLPSTTCQNVRGPFKVNEECVRQRRKRIHLAPLGPLPLVNSRLTTKTQSSLSGTNHAPLFEIFDHAGITPRSCSSNQGRPLSVPRGIDPPVPFLPVSKGHKHRHISLAPPYLSAVIEGTLLSSEKCPDQGVFWENQGKLWDWGWHQHHCDLSDAWPTLELSKATIYNTHTISDPTLKTSRLCTSSFAWLGRQSPGRYNPCRPRRFRSFGTREGPSRHYVGDGRPSPTRLDGAPCLVERHSKSRMVCEASPFRPSARLVEAAPAGQATPLLSAALLFFGIEE